MAGLTEDATWEAQIYQLEQTDPVLGGPPNLALGQGFDNVPHQQLARRTQYLKQEVEALAAALAGLPGGDFVTAPEMTAAISAAIDGLVNGAPGALDTLYELAQELQSQDSAIAGLLTQIAAKYGAPDRANQAEAEAGTVNDKVMTPLSVAWAIAALAPKPLGQEQTLQDMAGQRLPNTAYQNTTGRGIFIYVGEGGLSLDLSSDGLSWVTINPNPTSLISAFVPDQHYYRLSIGSGGIGNWWELR